MGERRELFGSGMTAAEMSAAIRSGTLPASGHRFTEADLGALMAGDPLDMTEPVTFAALPPDWTKQSDDPLADLAAAAETDLRRAGPRAAPLIVPQAFADEHGAALQRLGAELVSLDGSPYEPPAKSEDEIARQIAGYERETRATTAQLAGVFSRLGITVASL